MMKLDEYNRILTVHYSYTSLFSCDECVRRSLVQYVIELLRNRTIDIHNYSITMMKLDEFNRILTVHYSYTSLFSSDECVRRYVTLLLRNRTINIHNNSFTMLKLDEFNRILTVHYSHASCYSSDECVRRSLVQYVSELLRKRTIDIHNYSITMLKLDEYNRILTVHYSYTSLFSSDECVRRSLVQ